MTDVDQAPAAGVDGRGPEPSTDSEAARAVLRPLVDVEHDRSLEPSPTRSRRSPAQLLDDLAERTGAVRAETWVTFLVVAGCTLFVLYTVHPDLVLTANTPTGGDMGAHVIGPRFLVDHLIPRGRLTGWTPDWFAGYPIYGFYMVVPALAIAVLFTGLRSWLLAPALAISALLAVSGWLVPALWRLRRHLAVLGGFLFLWALPMPYGVGFKIVTVVGMLSLPSAGWAFAKLADLRFPAPPLFAVAAVFYLYNREPAIQGIGNLIGGNMASTMAGEYSFSISLSITLVYLGVLARGFKTGRHRATAAVLLALVGLCHLLPFFFALLATLLMLAVQFRPKRLQWLAPVVVVAGLLASFWMLPFVWNRALTNDMGFEKLPYPKTHLVNYLLPQTLLWVAALAGLGVLAALLYRNRTALFLCSSVAATAVAVCVMPQIQLWNARVLPFFYLSLFLLAAFGVAAALRVAGEVAACIDGDHVLGMRTLFLVAAAVAAAVYLHFFTARPWQHGVASVDVGGHALLAALSLAGMAFALAEGAGRGTAGRGRLPALAATPVLALAAVAVIGFPLHVLPGRKVVTKQGRAVTDKQGAAQQQWLWFKSFDHNDMSAWARWNYTGYEGKTGTYNAQTRTYEHGWNEYKALVDTMASIGRRRGCGRTLWEQDNNLEGAYGTPMALMLLPYWTKSCITSEEGLYFESSSTTPYHWLLASEASAQPSNPQRNLPYRSLDLAQAVPHMQLMGVKYYLAASDAAVKAADQQRELTPIATSGPWHIYEVRGAAAVVGLDHLPVVWDRAMGQHSWLKPAISWFSDPARWSVPFAAGGPRNWPRVKTQSSHWSTAWAGVGSDVQSRFGTTTPDPLPATPRIGVRKARVTHVHTGTDTISFDVDRPGTPVLVRTSYFPNWKASGATGPWRVTPNFMVVVPTARHVELHYGREPVDWAAMLLTLFGIGAAVGLSRLAPVAVGGRWRSGQPRHLRADEWPPPAKPDSEQPPQPEAPSPASTSGAVDRHWFDPVPAEPSRPSHAAGHEGGLPEPGA